MDCLKAVRFHCSDAGQLSWGPLCEVLALIENPTDIVACRALAHSSDALGLDGVMIYNPSGKLIGRIKLRERCANVCFGGAKRNRLFMAAGQSLYSLYVNAEGVAGG